MDQRMKQLFRSNTVWILFIAILTALSGEIKLSPFTGESFRFGVGTITFLLMFLIRQPKHLFLTGITTATLLLFFRTWIDVSFNDMNLSEALVTHIPSGMYYIVYSVAFSLLKVNRFREHPIYLGIFASILEIISNSVEHLLRILFLPTLQSSIHDWFLLIIVAIFRSFFVVGLFSSVSLAEQKRKLEENLTVGSDLYIETLYLQKSMNHIEQIMADSYDLYRVLKKKEEKEYGKRALHIAQEIHEVKKDTQRIYSGLSEITLIKDDQELFLLSQIMNMSVTSNQKYAQLIHRQVTINWSTTIDFKVGKYMLLMAIINNIVANAVESIEQAGVVDILVTQNDDKIKFIISDNGKGIEEEDTQLIFEAGYTTKFSEKGVAATGIGLSHVQEAIKLLEGEISIESSPLGTTFNVDIPRRNMEQRGLNQ